jgi:hypothetical protein
MVTVAFHGLKRIWEFLDERGLHTDTDRDKYIDIHNITDTKLLAYLLDPDSVRPQAADNDEKLREAVFSFASSVKRANQRENPRGDNFDETKVFWFNLACGEATNLAVSIITIRNNLSGPGLLLD